MALEAEARCHNVIESIPNISDGSRLEVIDALADAVRHVSGIRWLDRSSDRSHNRSVFTFAAESQVLEQAAVALTARAVALIDLRQQRGVHPRMGAVDVMPFVPLAGATMADCVRLAQGIGAAVGEKLGIPVFLYEEAATAPHRRRLEEIRRGEFEGLAAKLKDPRWRPDFGPAAPHPTFGAMAIGARAPLIAFNVNLASARLDLARKIASVVRERDGGLPGVKALGLALPARHIVQVSMNLTDYRRTPPAVAFDAVELEARRLGIGVLDSEIVGLVPRAALSGTTPAALKLSGFSDDRLLEVRLEASTRSTGG
jgi:glutamate formiminotransferase / 5-formyltetrahydrofolate cyclo-ligase